MESQVGTLCANLHHRIHNIKSISKYTNFSTRYVFVKSIVLGKLNYAIPLLSQCTNKQKQKLHKVIMSAARTIIGNYCYKKSIKYILKKCKMQDNNDLFTIWTLEFIHKALFYHLPKSMLKYYNLRKNKRKNSKITTIYRPKSVKFKNHFIYKGIHIYNTLPTEIKSLPVNTFGKRITQYVHSNCVWDSAD